MSDFSYMGRSITLSGDGDKDSPFVIKGTGWNPALAAELERYVAGKYFNGRTWSIARTRTEQDENHRQLSVLTLKVLWDHDEVVETDMWFDITEAMNRVP